MNGSEIKKGDVIVVALGGNAIMDKKGKAPFEEQRAATRKTMKSVAELIVEGYHIVLTHGNGPVVGNILIRNEAVSSEIPPMPLEICVADSTGGLGYMLQQALCNELRAVGIKRDVVTLVTQVRVRRSDPAFGHPTKPIGPFYSREEAASLMASNKWRMVEDSGRGWRRIVASPHPIALVEGKSIRTLAESGAVVIAAGGGGIPVIRRRDGSLEGVDAVIDKDWTANLLAQVVGARYLALLTGVEKVALNFKKPEQRDIDEMDAGEASRYLRQNEFPPGSMGPKIAASVAFLEDGGHGVLITSPDHLIDGLERRTGTWIVPDRHLG